jgi:2-isopropylmalate synthase
MIPEPAYKYAPAAPITLPGRRWPDRCITKAPIWLSTDLRDGNQALAEPMDPAAKQHFFDLLVRIGVKEIEVAFPSASHAEFTFVRSLIEGGRIPGDVWPQVFTQSREELVRRTFDSVRGAPRAIVHIYNAIAPLFRDVVFGMSRAEVVRLAVAAARLCRDLAAEQPETEFRFEYSPETFNMAEPEFALEICEAVLEVWRPTPERPVILNLPASVEAATPNVYADQIEWFCGAVSCRDSLIVSVHPHNDRGTAVAAAELAVMAGADRVEGCLFGNGERTGNVDLVTLAMNLYGQGVAPGLDFSDMAGVVAVVEDCTRLPVPARWPYAGELVFTAFSGSHQDAIRKGFAAQARRNDEQWRIPYLPIDPADLGRSYQAVIRVNSQSGKGGVAWVLEQDHGLKLPRAVQAHFAAEVQRHSDATGAEIAPDEIWRLFQRTYFLEDGRLSLEAVGKDWARVTLDGTVRDIIGRGNGPVAAFVAALRDGLGIDLDVTDYSEHAIGRGADARAAAYVEARTGDGRTVLGVGVSPNIVTASLRALVSAANATLETV